MQTLRILDAARVDEGSIMLQFLLFSVLLYLICWLVGWSVRAIAASYLRGQYAAAGSLDDDGDELAQNAKEYIERNTPSAWAMGFAFYAASAVFLLDYLSLGASWYLWPIGVFSAIAMGATALYSFTSRNQVQGALVMAVFLLWGAGVYVWYWM